MTTNSKAFDDLVEAARFIDRHGGSLAAFGNLSSIDRDANTVAIKASGTPLTDLRPEDFVVTDLDGQVVDGERAPSRDLAIHLALYRAFPAIGVIAHTHSKFATAWAQSGREIPCLGTTHADHFLGAVRVSRLPTREETRENFEHHVGRTLVAEIGDDDPMACPAILIGGHGPMAWGVTAMEAARSIVMLEMVAELAFMTLALDPLRESLPSHIALLHNRRERELRRRLTC